MEKRIHGHAEPRLMELLEAFQGYLETGEELSASIVANIDEENVVDVWGGFHTHDKTENWEHDTIVNVFSTTKTICALNSLILIDRGLLSINDTVHKFRAELESHALRLDKSYQIRLDFQAGNCK
ncbi:hypothetical protein BCIN_07g00080 [Botrytis cinerea B05.10]|uniref:Beta-lactamase-related domain-containing protein n=1 Tax=Botryotinia fuckeliana (strain B05.10) TaxID=332648 RepID=A0A384JLD3_BOTFB|nr:hypothetical protein BCIN_07g00080 [Botrytis cinerea B05.10]ATZ51363.1 hypothetical protein BCIN_07g00080 [Botrytis cinerea B05.10]